MFVNGTNHLIVLDANGMGAIENIMIGGANHALAALSQTTNHAPTPNAYQSEVEGAFFGGYVGDGSASDADGDRLVYKLEAVSGELADERWSVDPRTGGVFGDFTRTGQDGNAYSYLTISASDGIDTTTSTLTIWWGNRNVLPTAPGASSSPDDQEQSTLTFVSSDATLSSGGTDMFYV